MTDRELLEMAAKAAGLVVDRKWQAQRDAICDHSKASLWIFDGSTAWNPLKDDGDALRLAVKARLTVCADGDASVSAHTAYEPSLCFVTQFIKHGQDKQEATRRAITRAAAEIGKAMP